MDKILLREAGKTITEQPVRVTVTIPARNWWDRLMQNMKLKPTEKVFEVRPITLGNAIRISELLMGIDASTDLVSSLKKSFESIVKYGPVLADAVAIGLHNSKSEPPNYLKDFVRNNFTSPELFGVLSVIVKQINVSDFLTSIVLIQGINVLDQTSRVQQGS